MVDAEHLTRFLLLLDNFKAHRKAEFIRAVTEIGEIPWFYPPNVSDQIQVVDMGYGNEVKKGAKVEQSKWLENGMYSNRVRLLNVAVI